ncbi:MAG TPA: DedA family protein [Anaeromyxobacter sp.]|nr:DedA family protein [Anaeromyxobacter sp.]
MTPVRDPAAFLQRWHYLGLFAVLFIEEAGIPLPVPGDLFIAAMGFLASTGRASYLPAAGAVTGATVLGSSLLYLVSRHARRRLLSFAGRWLGYTSEKQARLEGWLSRHGAWAVVVGRLIPGLRIVMTVVAGALGVRRSTFALGTLLAGLIWATIYFFLGYALGSGYQRLAGEGELPPFVLAAAAAALVAGAVVLLRLRSRARAGVARPPDRHDAP